MSREIPRMPPNLKIMNRVSPMKTQKCISNLSLAVTSLFFGASQSFASPLLDSDLASYTVLGASSESHAPKITGEGTGGHAESVQAIAAINASPARGGSADPVKGSQRGVGADVMQLAQALHLARLANPGREAPAKHSSSNAAAEPGSPTRDNQNNARR